MDEQRTEEWFQARLGKVTASRISDVMMKPTTAGYQNYQAQLICERLTGIPTETFTSAAMQHGTDTEPRARAVYELETGLDVAETGFVPHPGIEMAGASPDGLVGSEGLVEIKCPQPATHIKTLIGGSIDRKYRLQMQWQMACTDRNWCDFASYCPALGSDLEIHIQRLKFDPEECAEITEAVSGFLGKIELTLTNLTSRYTKEAA